MSKDFKAEPIKPPTPPMQRIAIYAAVLLVVFLLGFVPMWLSSRSCASELATAQRELSLLRLQNTLASAAIDARRGEYEPARQATSSFFTSLRAEAARATGSALTDTQKQNLEPLLAGRDEVITLLARSDPASVDRLSDLYAAYRKAMGG